MRNKAEKRRKIKVGLFKTTRKDAREDDREVWKISFKSCKSSESLPAGSFWQVKDEIDLFLP